MGKKHSNAGIGSDNWLYIVSHALSLFAGEGGSLIIRPGDRGILIELSGIYPGDSRLHEDFEKLANSAVRVDLEES